MIEHTAQKEVTVAAQRAVATRREASSGRTVNRSSATLWADRFLNVVLNHWLVLLLLAMLIFVGLPFLAPVFMAAGWTRLGELIYTVYIPFCHQLPQRSWFLFGEKLTYSLDEINRVFPSTDPWQLRFFYGNPQMGWKVAWSDRMISFYTMTPVFGMVYALIRRWRPNLPPISLKLLLWALAPLAVDGVTHALSDMIYGISGGGFRDTNAWLMMLTGNAFPGFYAGDHLGTFNWWARLLTGLLAAWAVAFYTFPWLERLIRTERTQYFARVRVETAPRDEVGQVEGL